MRSVVIISAVAIALGVIIFKGYSPREANATGTAPRPPGDIELEYSDYESEGPLVFPRRPWRAEHAEPEGFYDATDAAPVEQVAPEADSAGGNGAAEEEPPVEWPPPTADAGADQTVWLGADELQLDGTGSSGDALSYYWQQVAGPNELEIENLMVAKTTARKFPTDVSALESIVYEFELIVTDIHGQEATDTVRYHVKAAPALSIRPPGTRQLAYRDGYLLAHFEAVQTNRRDDRERFEIRSDSELSLSHLGGEGEFEITAEETEDGYVYVLSIYYEEGEPSTWLEFFVDTPERVPAVLQFGVHWE